MAEYLSPGVYVEEVETGAMTIEGVSTSTAGFLGETERGPVEPTFLGSFADFRRQFGGFAEYRRGGPLEGTNLAYAVDGFFRNGGSRCYVGRVTSATERADVGLGRYAPPLALLADEEHVDFGRVVTGRTVTETVEVRHAGIENDPAIEVADVRIAGGPGDAPGEFDVLLPEGRETPLTLGPDEPLVLEVVYRPTGDADHAASLTVDHDGDDPPLAVPLRGAGVTPEDGAEFAVAPAAVDFGTVPLDATRTESVTVRNDGLEGADAIVVTGVPLVPDGGDVTPFDVTNEADVTGASLDPGDRVTVDVAVEHDTAEGVAAALRIEYDRGTQSESTQLPVRGDVVDPAGTLGADVTAVAFGTVVTTTTASETHVLRNVGGADDDPLTITDVGPDSTTEFDASLAAATVPATLAPGESTPVTIEFAPTTDGDVTDAIVVEYEDGTGTRTREIDVTGTGEDVEGEYAARPPAAEGLDFDEVVVGESATRTVELSNAAPAGATDVTVTAVGFVDDDDGEYALPENLLPEDPADPVATLSPGESLELPVTVTPDGTGPVEAELEVSYENGTTDTERFALAATAVDPVVGVEAVGPGAWGGRVAVRVENGARSNDTFDVTVRYWTDPAAVEGDAETVWERNEQDVEETFADLTTTQSSSTYYETTIDSGSRLIEVSREGPDRPANGTTFLDVPPDPDAAEEVGLPHYAGSEAAPRGERTGLAGFAEVDDVSIVCVPDENAVDGLTAAVVDHCVGLEDRFAVLQTERGADPAGLPSNAAISDYAALYYPQIRIVDPETGIRRLVPPGGHVAGIYARSDSTHGVHKAPANETVRGAVDLEFPVTKADQDRLNPKGVNAIRSFPGRGIRVWGARTTSPNPLWKYVNVRRLFITIEESIDEGTQWAVFEPNDEKLWARVRQSVGNYLTTVWRDGGLVGATPEEAFYVRADRTTMTQTEIDEGKLIVEIGVAPVKPAEFVIFRITQWTEGVEGGS